VVLSSEPGSTVVAAASGEVTFAGQVAGVLWVVVQANPRVGISHGRLAEIGGQSGPAIVAGTRVTAGTPIGRAGPTTYLGATAAGRPVDPWPSLSGRAHLVRPGGLSVGCSPPRTAPPSGSRPLPG
jgi:septal ring factor EnvC (AmiA/AmiB activator)